MSWIRLFPFKIFNGIRAGEVEHIDAFLGGEVGVGAVGDTGTIFESSIGAFPSSSAAALWDTSLPFVEEPGVRALMAVTPLRFGPRYAAIIGAFVTEG